MGDVIQTERLRRLQALVRADLDLVEGKLGGVLGSAEGLAGEVSEHILSSPGKRLRPILVLLASRLAPRNRDLAVSAAAVQSATARPISAQSRQRAKTIATALRTSSCSAKALG